MATVVGIVEEVIKSSDGNWHINIQSNNDIIIAEIIPEYPLTPPRVGDKIKI